MRDACHRNVGCNAWIRTELGKEICETASDLEIFISSAKILIDAKNTEREGGGDVRESQGCSSAIFA